MKILTLLPKEIKKTYVIQRDKKRVEIHEPAYINIDFDERFGVETNGTTWSIQNSKVCVALWIGVKIMHVTVFTK